MMRNTLPPLASNDLFDRIRFRATKLAEAISIVDTDREANCDPLLRARKVRSCRHVAACPHEASIFQQVNPRNKMFRPFPSRKPPGENARRRFR